VEQADTKQALELVVCVAVVGLERKHSTVEEHWKWDRDPAA